MKAMTWAIVAGGLWLGVSAAGGAPTSGKAAPPKVKAVTLEIRHRVFHEFQDREKTVLDKEFAIGDGEYTGQVVEFVPDFAINLKTHEVLSRSNEPKNPAFRIIVRQKDVPQDTTWAFLNMPPHFAKKSLLAFKVLRIDFFGRSPIIAKPDTTGAGGQKS